MAQEFENYQSDDAIDFAIPKASTDIKPGDVVVMSRACDPRSLSGISATPGRIRPIGAVTEGHWVAGVVNGKFTSDVAGATLYATPDASVALRLFRRGIVRLAISNTSGKKGDYVAYSSGATGAQVFVINNRKIGYAVARLAKDFSGATANDTQACELIQHPQQAQSIYHFLENRVLEGCNVKLATQPASRVRIGEFLAGTVPALNRVVIQGKMCDIAANKSLAYGGVGSAASSTVRFKWVTARSASFGVRSCSVTKAALASFTAAGVTIGLFRPVAMTAGEFPIALLIQFSAATQSAARIKNVRGPSALPSVGSWGI